MTDLQYNLLRMLERAFCVLALLMLMNAFLPFVVSWNFTPTSDSGPDTGTGNIRFQIISLSIYTIALVTLLAYSGSVGRLMAANLPVMALLVLALFSSFWSPYPDATFRRAFALALSTFFAIYLVMRFRPAELLELLGWAMICACFLSLYFAVLTAWGVHQFGAHHGTWRGTFGHKNELGRYMALGVLLFLVLLGQTRGLKRLLWWFGLALTGFLLAMSTSKTPLAVMLGLLIVWPLLKALRAGRLPLNIKMPVVLIVGFGGLVVLLINFLAIGLEALGRDLTFTGRTTLWNLAIGVGMNNDPWLGAGYRAFWTERGARDVYAQLGWGMDVANGHNGYLDVWLELGFVGLALFVMTLVMAGKRIWRRLVHSNDPVGTWYALLFGFLLVYSVTEKVILSQSELVWALYLVTLFYLTPKPLAAAKPAPARNAPRPDPSRPVGRAGAVVPLRRPHPVRGRGEATGR